MAKYYVKLPDWEPLITSYGGNTEANYDARAITLRDAILNVLDPDDLQTNWMVSEITKWAGSITDGYAFTIFHRNGGSNTGPAWTIFLPGVRSTTVAALSEIFQSAQTSNYWVNPDGNVSFTLDGTFQIHYNPLGGTTDPYDIGYSLTDGSLSSGDFTAPSSNPYSAAATFMPSTVLKGLCYDRQYSNSDFHRMVMIADDSKPYLAIYFTYGAELVPDTLSVLGKIVVPYRSTDTELDAVISLEQNFTNTVQGSIIGSHYQAISDTGSLITPDIFYSNVYTTQNVPFSDNTYPWDVVGLASSSYIKGWLDSDIIRVMGPADRDLFSLYNGGDFIKLSQHLCFPYVANTVVWPTSPGS